MNYVKLICHRLTILLWYFIIYSFTGWCIETIYMSSSNGYFVSRGFLFGPFCPIYGFGALILLVILKPVKHNIVLFSVGAILLTSTLEYITGFILEWTFHNTWWDYSGQPFNLNGRICLKNSLSWGVISVTMIYWIHPFYKYAVKMIPENIKTFLPGFFLVYVLTDLLIVAASITLPQSKLEQLHFYFQAVKAGLAYMRDVILKEMKILRSGITFIDTRLM